MTESLFDVLVAGELYVDLILAGFDEWPQPGREVFAKQYRRELGGGTAITACGLAKLGTRVSVLGAIGADDDAWLKTELKHRDVDINNLFVDASEPTGITVAASTPVDRAFLTYVGANKNLPLLLESAESLPLYRHLHLACAPSASVLESLIRHKSGTVSIDAGWHPTWLDDPHIRTMLKDVDLFFPNEIEAAHMTKEKQPMRMLDVFQEHGLQRVALKLGAKGAALLWDGEVWFEPAVAVTPIDTTGAGDCFDAGFLHSWFAGETAHECLRIANLCGAKSTEALGGIAGFPSPEQVCGK